VDFGVLGLLGGRWGAWIRIVSRRRLSGRDTDGQPHDQDHQRGQGPGEAIGIFAAMHDSIVVFQSILALRPGSQIAGIVREDLVRTAVTDAANLPRRPPAQGALNRLPANWPTRLTDWLRRVGCFDRLPSQEVHGRLIQSGPQLKAFVGARDVANRNLHSADDWLDADARRP
jgi:hypothetical protein